MIVRVAFEHVAPETQGVSEHYNRKLARLENDLGGGKIKNKTSRRIPLFFFTNTRTSTRLRERSCGKTMTLSHQKRENLLKHSRDQGRTVKGRALFYHSANEPEEG